MSYEGFLEEVRQTRKFSCFELCVICLLPWATTIDKLLPVLLLLMLEKVILSLEVNPYLASILPNAGSR